jgi:hypothetical protein
MKTPTERDRAVVLEMHLRLHRNVWRRWCWRCIKEAKDLAPHILAAVAAELEAG